LQIYKKSPSSLTLDYALYYGIDSAKETLVEIERKTEEAIFKAAIQFNLGAEREAYILEACGDDQELLAGIRTLLKYHDANSFLDIPIFEPEINLDESSLAEEPGTIIGRYKLLEKIGEGGMAVVYMAEQERPIHRKVALKIIKLGNIIHAINILLPDIPVEGPFSTGGFPIR